METTLPRKHCMSLWIRNLSIYTPFPPSLSLSLSLSLSPATVTGSAAVLSQEVSEQKDIQIKYIER